MDQNDPNSAFGGRGRRNGRGREGFIPISAKELFDKQPPVSPEAEMSLLGSMILDPNVVPDVLGLIKNENDFYAQKHAHIYKAVVDVYDQRHSGDLVQIVDMLRDRGVLEQVGGPQYLAELAEAVPTAVNAPHFARIVADKAKLRRLIDAAGQILYDAYHAADLGPEGSREVLDSAEMRVFEIAQEQHGSDPTGLAELLDIELKRIEQMDFEGGALSGVASGFAEMDEMLRGLQPGEMLILAARPSMGKTALALNLCEQIARGGVCPPMPAKGRVPVGLFSLEMSKNAIVQRLLSARSGVSSQMMRGGHKIPDQALRDLIFAAEELKHEPIYIDDTPSLTVLNLRARARRMVAQHGVKVIMIDYLQLMSAPGAARESRQVEVSTISRGVKSLARELNIPVVCLSQLNRASESREGNRPRMSDLRESGSIEQDADVIMLLHREEYYHIQDEDWKMENPDKVGLAEVIVAKQRNGPTGVIKLSWDNRTTRFKNYDASAQAPGEIDAAFGGGGGGGGGGSSYGSPSQAAAGGPFAGAKRGPATASPRAWTHESVPQPDIKARPAAPTNPSEPPPFDVGPMGDAGAGPDGPAFDDRYGGGGQGSSSPPPTYRGFAPGKKTGPIENHRDGGGPDLDDDDIPI
jgi:replicative DNA helicase